MSNTLSRKQIQQMRRLTNARFPMLGVVVVAALFVVRVPVIQSWEAHADATKLRRPTMVAQKETNEPEEPQVDQEVAVADAQTESQEDVTATDVEPNTPSLSTKRWFDLLTQFQPTQPNDSTPQDDDSQSESADSTVNDDETPTDDLNDLDLRHVSQLEPTTDDNDVDSSEEVVQVEEEDDRVLKLHNPAGNGGIVNFVVDDQTYSIAVGETVEFTGKDQWLLKFHRGGEFGNSRVMLKPGSYSFAVTKGGWRLAAGDRR